MEEKNRPPIKKSMKSKSFCCVYGCNTMLRRDPFLSYHLFPKKGVRTVEVTKENGQTELVDSKKAWEINLKMAKPASSFMKVCSRHFNEDAYNSRGFKNVLIKSAVPTQNLPSAVKLKTGKRTNMFNKSKPAPILSAIDDPFKLALSVRKAATNTRNDLQSTSISTLNTFTRLQSVISEKDLEIPKATCSAFPKTSLCTIVHDSREDDNLQRDALEWMKPLNQITDNTANQQENDKRIKEEEPDTTYEHSFSANGNQHDLYPPLTIKKEEEIDIEIEEHEIEENTHQNASHNVFDKNSLIVVDRARAIQMEIQNKNPIKLKSNIVNKEPLIPPVKGSSCGNKKINPTPIRIQRVRSDRKNIQRKISNVFIKQEAHNVPNRIRKRKNIHLVELCVLCSTDLSRCRTKKSLSDCLEVILKVTDVDVTQYKILPYSCKVCYNYILFIQKFQKQVANAKALICEKLANVASMEKPCEFEFVSVDANEKVPILHNLNNQVDIEIELDDAEEIHVTETQNGDVVMTNFNKDTSKITNLGITQSPLKEIGIVESKNSVLLPIAEVNIEEGSTFNSPMKSKAGVMGRSSNTVPLPITEVNIKEGNSSNPYIKSKTSIKGRNVNTIPLPITEVNVEGGIKFNSYMKNKSSSKAKSRNTVPLPITEVNIKEGNSSNPYIKSKTSIKGRNVNTIPLPITEVNVEGGIKFNSYMKNKSSSKAKSRNTVPLPITEVNIEEGHIFNGYMKSKPRIKGRSKKTVSFPMTEVNIEGGNNFNSRMKNNKFSRKIKIKLGFSSGKKKEVRKGSLCKVCGKLLERGFMRDHMRSHKIVLEKPSNKKRSSQCRRSYSHTNSSHQLLHEEKKSVCHICK